MKYVLLLIIMFASAAQAVTLEDVQKRFAEQNSVRAEFTQERRIKSINTPLISTGKMILSRDNGLFWQQQSPFVTTLILRDDAMIQRIEGLPDQIITADSNPQMFQFNALLKALVKADKPLLEHNFTLNFLALAQEKWQLTLTPTTTPLDKLFTEIQLQGDRVLNSVILIDKQGDSTTIRFHAHQLTPATLTPDEVRHFE